MNLKASRDARPDVASDAPPPAKEKQRSRTGCQTCRSRKVKCDERPGGCRNCERLNIPCPHPVVQLTQAADAGVLADGIVSSGLDNKSGTVRTQAGLRRSRTYRSCQLCRSSKSRCSGERPVCLRCREKDLECVYDGRQVPAWVEAMSAKLEPGRLAAGGSSSGSLSPKQARSRNNSHDSSSLTPESHYGTPNSQLGYQYPPNLDDLEWLNSADLPNRDRIALLVEEYFTNMHCLRSFGFIHKPTFLQQLDERIRAKQGKDALLYTICSLGAKFCALRYATEVQIEDGFALSAGNQWAERARYFLYTNFNNVSIETLMTIVLLHEHELRIGNYASAFTLTGVAVRMAQSLQINLESSTDILCLSRRGLPAASREARRRLMWSVYTMDAWVGSGVDELTLLRDEDMKIQLPCNERSFVFQIPCLVETLQPGCQLPFITPEMRSKGPVDSLDLQAQFIRLLSIRKQVLRYVKHLDTAKPPWIHESDFLMLERSLQKWHDELPLSLRFSQTALYMRKESSQLGGLLFLHITYHQTLCDLNRIGMRDLFKIRSPVDFPAEQGDMMHKVQDRCFHHAMAVASVYEEALRHGHEALADTWLSVVAHDAARVIVFYGMYCRRQAPPDAVSGQHVCAMLHVLLRALKMMIASHTLAIPLHSAAVAMVKRANIIVPPELDLSPTTQRLPPMAEMDRDRHMYMGKPAQFTPEYVLNPLAIYRMARQDISDGEKHAPEHSPTFAALGSHAVDEALAQHLQQQQQQQQHQQHQQHHQINAPSATSLLPDGGGPGGLDDTSFLDGSFGLHAPAGPSAFDDMQTYLPLMLSNFSIPMHTTTTAAAPGAGDMHSQGAGGGGVDFSGFSVDSVYPVPPSETDAAIVDLAMPAVSAAPEFTHTEQQAWG